MCARYYENHLDCTVPKQWSWVWCCHLSSYVPHEQQKILQLMGTINQWTSKHTLVWAHDHSQPIKWFKCTTISLLRMLNSQPKDHISPEVMEDKRIRSSSTLWDGFRTNSFTIRESFLFTIMGIWFLSLDYLGGWLTWIAVNEAPTNFAVCDNLGAACTQTCKNVVVGVWCMQVERDFWWMVWVFGAYLNPFVGETWHPWVAISGLSCS